MTDRRRINGPASGTEPATFENKLHVLSRPLRIRKPNELRKIFLQTGVVPAAAGSAYFELEVPSSSRNFIPTTSTIKLSCAVQGPKPLPRNSSFSPNLQLTASIKFASFATRQRRGYLRDNIERDLGSHLENALNGVIIPDRWPKSAISVAVTVLEGEEDCLWNEEHGTDKGIGGVGLMNVLAGSITVSMAALVNAKIDCLDLLTGGVAARAAGATTELLDPCPSEHEDISTACVVGYMPARDEIVEIWSKSSVDQGSSQAFETLVDAAVKAAKASNKILMEIVKEDSERQIKLATSNKKMSTSDVEMVT